MYFALGQVAGTVFHNLFDQGTDTAIRFPEQSRFSARGPGADWLELRLPLPGPGLVRLAADYYTKTLGVPYYVGLLSAASIYGAGHQQANVFQVVAAVVTDMPFHLFWYAQGTDEDCWPYASFHQTRVLGRNLGVL